MNKKPFAAAAEQNRSAILPVLKEEFKNCSNVLEIGSGTGQHAVYFSKQLSYLIWQTSDKKEMLPAINLWLEDCETPNTPKPIELDVCQDWPDKTFDAAFGANITHIMHWHETEAMFSGLNKVLSKSAVFCLYGPFNFNGEYTSRSNQNFDQWLKTQDPDSSIRDKNDLDQLAIKNHFQPHKQYEMPENNFILCWKKHS